MKQSYNADKLDLARRFKTPSDLGTYPWLLQQGDDLRVVHQLSDVEIHLVHYPSVATVE